jgi:hypothetical protein
MTDNFKERRSEPRRIIDKYYSVEFLMRDLDFSYQFKIRDISSKGISVLVEEDSYLFNHIKVGEILKLKYYRTDSSKPTEYLRTEIRHITKDDTGRFKGLCLVGLSILEDQDSKRVGIMKVVCPQCNVGYKIISTKILQGRRAVTKCKKCGAKIVIEPSATQKVNYST